MNRSSYIDTINDYATLEEPTVGVGLNPLDIAVLSRSCMTSRGVSPDRSLKILCSNETHDTISKSVATSSMLSQLIAEGYVGYRRETDIQLRVITTKHKASCFRSDLNYVFDHASSHETSVFDYGGELFQRADLGWQKTDTTNQLYNTSRRIFGEEFQSDLSLTLGDIAKLEVSDHNPGLVFVYYIILLAAYHSLPHQSVREFITEIELRGERAISQAKSDLEDEGLVESVKRGGGSAVNFHTLQIPEGNVVDDISSWIVSGICSLREIDLEKIS